MLKQQNLTLVFYTFNFSKYLVPTSLLDIQNNKGGNKYRYNFTYSNNENTK